MNGLEIYWRLKAKDDGNFLVFKALVDELSQINISGQKFYRNADG